MRLSVSQQGLSSVELVCKLVYTLCVSITIVCGNFSVAFLTAFWCPSFSFTFISSPVVNHRCHVERKYSIFQSLQQSLHITRVIIICPCRYILKRFFDIPSVLVVWPCFNSHTGVFAISLLLCFPFCFLSLAGNEMSDNNSGGALWQLDRTLSTDEREGAENGVLHSWNGHPRWGKNYFCEASEAVYMLTLVVGRSLFHTSLCIIWALFSNINFIDNEFRFTLLFECLAKGLLHQ